MPKKTKFIFIFLFMVIAIFTIGVKKVDAAQLPNWLYLQRCSGKCRM